MSAVATATETKERPILFSGLMVRAILEGRKTQTRRVLKVPKWIEHMEPDLARAFPDKAMGVTPCLQVPCANGSVQRLRNPWGFPDVAPIHLWVRETWAVNEYYNGRPGNKCGPIPEVAVECRESPDAVTVLPGRSHRSIGDERGKWRPSIFMPRWASRITLEITNVRVVRLQGISPNDAVAEGCPSGPILGQLSDGAMRIAAQTRIDWFHNGWDGLNAKRGYGWNVNPWVWVIEFRRLSTHQRHRG